MASLHMMKLRGRCGFHNSHNPCSFSFCIDCVLTYVWFVLVSSSEHSIKETFLGLVREWYIIECQASIEVPGQNRWWVLSISWTTAPIWIHSDLLFQYAVHDGILYYDSSTLKTYQTIVKKNLTSWRRAWLAYIFLEYSSKLTTTGSNTLVLYILLLW